MGELSTPGVARTGPPSKCGREKEFEKLSQKYWEGIWSIDRVPMEAETALATLNSLKQQQRNGSKKAD